MSTDRSIVPPIRDFDILSLPPATDYDVTQRVKIRLIKCGNVPVNRITVMFDHGLCGQYGEDAGSILDYRLGALLTAPLLSEGCHGHSAADIADRLDFEGAMMQPSVARHFTSVSLLSTNSSTPQLLPLLLDVMTRPTFSEDAYAAIRSKAAQNRATQLSRIGMLASEGADLHLYGAAHPYNVLPTPAEINATTLDNVRRYHESILMASDVTIIVSGPVDDSLAKHIRQFGIELSARLHSPALKTTDIVAAVPEAPLRRHIAVENSLQTAVSMAFPVDITRDNTDYPGLRAAAIALGGYFGSRLMTNIREKKGLTYGIGAALSGERGTTALTIDAQCTAGSADLVIDEINAEIKRLCTEPMGVAELQQLRSFIESSLASTLDNHFSIGEYYTTMLQVGIPHDYYDRQWRMLKALTPDVIRTLADSYISGVPAIAVTAGA